MSYGQYGVWSEQAGGFIETGLASRQTGAALDRHIAAGESSGDLAAYLVCPWHDEQREFDCEECAEE